MAEYDPIEIARQYAPKFDKPVVDMVEVVRCKDCAYWLDLDEDDLKEECCYCTMNDIYFKSEEFCSRGERKDEVDNGR